jgi:hypothetical protein
VAESPEEKEALAKLDEETREVGSEEEDKELAREGQFFLGGWLTSIFRPVRFWSKGDPMPGSEPGLREALREGAEERKEKLGSAPPQSPPE